MKRKTTITKEVGTEQGTVWHWQIKEGRKVIFGGYCRTKKDAISDAASVGGGGAERFGRKTCPADKGHNVASERPARTS